MVPEAVEAAAELAAEEELAWRRLCMTEAPGRLWAVYPWCGEEVVDHPHHLRAHKSWVAERFPAAESRARAQHTSSWLAEYAR